MKQPPRAFVNNFAWLWTEFKPVCCSAWVFIRLGLSCRPQRFTGCWYERTRGKGAIVRCLLDKKFASCGLCQFEDIFKCFGGGEKCVYITQRMRQLS